VVVLESLRAAVDELVGVDAGALSDSELGELLVELHALESRIGHEAARLTRVWDARKAWAVDRARSAASWLAHRTRMPHAAAQRQVRLGRCLRDMPGADAAWASGEIGAAHVSALSRARTPATAEVYERDETVLVDKARTMRFDDFTRVVAYWSQGADPDGAEVDARNVRAQRQVHLSRTFGGAWVGDVLLDPIAGSIVYDTLHGIEKELFEADWAAARERLGREPAVFELDRTPAQRRADALVEMATRARTAPKNGRRPAPLFTVLVGYETLAGRVCELAGGTAVTPGSLVPWLDEAYIERVVFDGPSRVIDVGAQRRLFEGATRRAVEVRDKGRCYHPDCDDTHDLQVDPIEPWNAGGPTIQSNGRLACGHHNRARNGRSPPHGAG
jgi:hypothetical protein